MTTPATYQPADPETVFTYGAPALKFGDGAADEIGYDLCQYGARRVLVVTDPASPRPATRSGSPTRWRRSASRRAVFDGVHVEPTDASIERPIECARDTGPWDAFVAVGGGSSIDTAKAVNLLTTNAGELMDYVNAPVGGGRAPENPLKPLVAVPTTTGTGVGEHDDLRARRARAEGEDRASATPGCGRPSPSSTPR